jgi:hypothetical protein
VVPHDPVERARHERDPAGRARRFVRQRDRWVVELPRRIKVLADEGEQRRTVMD